MGLILQGTIPSCSLWLDDAAALVSSNYYQDPLLPQHLGNMSYALCQLQGIWNWVLCFCVTREKNTKKLKHWKGSLTLQGTNISHLGKRKIIFKYALSGGYVNSLEGNHPKKGHQQNCQVCFFSVRWKNWTLLLYILNQFNKLWEWLIAFHGYLGSMLVWFFWGVSQTPKQIRHYSISGLDGFSGLRGR